MNLPELSIEEVAQQQAMRELLEKEIREAGGAIPFDRYMELALYAPGLGYYVSGAHKFGPGGDFITAPEISPYFGYCLGRQCVRAFEELPREILEFGAGTGVMAMQILQELERLQPDQPVRYRILEVSPELRQRQHETFLDCPPHYLEQISWVDEVPEDFSGVILANEVLDAMPVHVFRRTENAVEELWVSRDWDGRRLKLEWRKARAALKAAVKAIEAWRGEFPDGYVSEVNLRQAPWLEMLASRLDRALMLFMDYGYTGREYYHPERSMGTLICHYCHQAHEDVLLRPGLQDITANVDFSALRDAAVEAGFDFLGFTTQAGFLLGSGLDEMLGRLDPDDVETHMQVMQGVKQLIMPDAMGERFKVLALGKGVEATTLSGFS
ncbi:class I SAM-dependent methyltransferase [Thiolapillus sp.]